MANEKPDSTQPSTSDGDSRGNKIIVLTPDQQREIDELIVDLGKAARRIDEARRRIRRSG